MTEYKGDKYLLKDSVTFREIIDQELVKKYVPDGDLSIVKKSISVVQKRTSRLDESKPEYTPPNISNMNTLEAFIDALGQTREEMKKLEKDEGFFKDQINRILSERAVAAQESPDQNGTS